MPNTLHRHTRRRARPPWGRAWLAACALTLGACNAPGGNAEPTGPYASQPDHRWAEEAPAPTGPKAGANELSSLAWIAATNGWGPPERNASNGEPEAGDGPPITLRGREYASGLGVHAPSRIQYHLGGNCTRFTATVGVDDAVPANAQASVRFEVRSGGTVLYASPRMTRGSNPERVEVDLRHRADLSLVVLEEDDQTWDRADWAGAQLDCGSPNTQPALAFLHVSEGETLRGRVRSPGVSVIGGTVRSARLELNREDPGAPEPRGLEPGNTRVLEPGNTRVLEHDSNAAPACLTDPCGPWDTTALEDGPYTLKATATIGEPGAPPVTLTDGVRFSVRNTTPTGPPRGGPSYFLDCRNGRDDNSGTSPDQPWLHIARANATTLPTSAALYLKRGCSWDETLYASWSGTALAPAQITAYGSGPRPAIRNAGAVGIEVSGSHVLLDNLEITASPPAPDPDARACPNQPRGKQEGVLFLGGSSFGTLQNARISGMSTGLRILNSSHNRVRDNEFAANNVMETLTAQIAGDDVGAQAIVLNGSDNEISDNTFWGHKACSEDFGEDGAALEVFVGSRNFVHHNRSVWGDSTFAELGGLPDRLARDNVFAYNLYVPGGTVDGSFLVARGDRSPFGANPGTRAYNNTAFGVSIGTSCFDGCSRAILSSRNNIFVQREQPFRDVSVVYADAPFDEGHNLYFREGRPPLVNIEGGTIGATSRLADPLFTDPWAGKFTLLPQSPARATGVAQVVAALGIRKDLAGNPVPQAGPLNLGVFQKP